MKQFHFFQLQKNNNLFLDKQLISFNIGLKNLKIIDNFVKKLFELNENRKFKSLHEVQRLLNTTSYYKLNKDLDIMTRLESFILKCLKKKILNKSIIGVEFPINVRIVHPSIPNQIKKRYSTTSIHCDPWAGEPDDMINVIINLIINKKTSKVKIVKTTNKEAKLYKKLSRTYKKKDFLNSKKYFKELRKLEEKDTYNIKNVRGQTFVFGGFLPHYTYNKGNEVRLGLEFRLRTKDPFSTLTRWKSRLNRSGRYWYLPNKNHKDFLSKINDEFSMIKRKSKKKLFLKLRKQEIKELNYKL